MWTVPDTWPRRGSVHTRPILEVLDDSCRPEGTTDDHEQCVLLIGASWPEPGPYADLDHYEVEMTTEGRGTP